jgi:hypothetical protein
LAIGYGRGNLEYIVHKGIGRWLFEPKFNASEFDTIPEDGWIGFLTPTRKNSSTRENARPFNIEEQKRILRYGACLTCHNSEEFKRNSLSNYEEQLDQLSRECVIPTWN